MPDGVAFISRTKDLILPSLGWVSFCYPAINRDLNKKY